MSELGEADLTEMIARIRNREEATALWRTHKTIWQTYHTGLVQIALNEAAIQAASPPSTKRGI